MPFATELSSVAGRQRFGRFAPHGSDGNLSRYHGSAEPIFRSAGNNQGRGRLGADGNLRAQKRPRGLILMTGEDIPRGHSVRARSLIVEVAPGDINVGMLTECQRAGHGGLLATAVAGLVRWIAGDYTLIEDRRRQCADVGDGGNGFEEVNMGNMQMRILRFEVAPLAIDGTRAVRAYRGADEVAGVVIAYDQPERGREICSMTRHEVIRTTKHDRRCTPQNPMIQSLATGAKITVAAAKSSAADSAGRIHFTTPILRAVIE